MFKRQGNGTRFSADTVVVAAMSICLAIAVVRISLVAATVPYAYYLSRAESDRPPARLSKRVSGSWPFQSWWGERRVPYRAGGDYLRVISQHSAARTLGCAIGYVAEQEQAKGVKISHVIVPADRQLLYGTDAGTRLVRADGTQYRSYWAPPAQDAMLFSEIPVVERPYDPLMTAGQSAELSARAKLTERADEFFVGEPLADSSGTWIVVVRQAGERREFIMVPAELSPIGGTL